MGKGETDCDNDKRVATAAFSGARWNLAATAACSGAGARSGDDGGTRATTTTTTTTTATQRGDWEYDEKSGKL